MSVSHHITALKDIFIEKDKEIEKLKKEVERLKEELEKIKTEEKEKHGLNTWDEYILFVCKDGKQRTSKEIFYEIKKMKTHPWSDKAKTPENSCNERCGSLFKDKKLLYKTNDKPIKYFILL